MVTETTQEIMKYKPVASKIDESTRKNCLVDLEFSKKLLYFYVIWFPRARYFYRPDFMQKGYILKSNQSNYYKVLGFTSLAATVIIVYRLYYNSIFAFLTIWIVFFFLSYLFDIYFNRQRQVKNIQKVIDQGEIPWGF